MQLVKEDGKDGAPTPPTAVTVASPQPNSSSQTHLHLLSMEPEGHFVTEAIIIKRHNSAYKYPASFTFTYEADAAQIAGVIACECACTWAPLATQATFFHQRWAVWGELVTFHCHGNGLQFTLGEAEHCNRHLQSGPDS